MKLGVRSPENVCACIGVLETLGLPGEGRLYVKETEEDGPKGIRPSPGFVTARTDAGVGSHSRQCVPGGSFIVFCSWPCVC